MPKGLRKIIFTFEDPTLTHYGGMFIFQHFCRKLQLKRFLQRHILWERRSSSYHPSDLILCLLFTMIAGLKRVSDTRILTYNSSFQGLLGLSNFPAASTLREFLKGISPQELNGLIRVHDLLRKKMWDLPKPRTSVIFDLDSTVLPLYGWKIQGAKKGYNPKKHGRPSYHPIICFEDHTRDTWNGLLCPGDTQPITIAPEFWKECREKVPKYVQRKKVSIKTRADAGFYDGKFIELLDEELVGYAVVAKLSPPLQAKIPHLRYRTFRKGWELQAAQFSYQPQGWKNPHSFVSVRRPVPQDPEERKQLTLWEFRDYFYHVLVHNLPLQPASVWRFYKNRARVELDIRELKESFPLGKIPTNNFLANAVHFELILLAYDLVNWFRRLCLPEKWQRATLHTLRTELLVLPARLVNIGHRNVLKLPPRYIHQDLFQQTIEKIDRLKIS